MKQFWALPAFLRLALASHHTISVLDDLLAYPQYEVLISDEFITDQQAEAKLSPASQQQDSSGLTHHDPPIHASSDKADDSPAKQPPIYEHMVLGGQQYLCSIPQSVTNPQNSSSSEPGVSPEEESLELERASDRGWQLLKGMEGSCIYFVSGWWSYSFCHNQGVKQFHALPPSKMVPIYPPMEDPNVASFVLGEFNTIGAGEEKQAKVVKDDRTEEETGLATLETKGDSRYLVQRLAGGTTCDLTGKERKIEVQFHCHPHTGNDRIGLIKETSTCAYLMVIYTPRLCNDIAFQPPKKVKPNPISCHPVVNEDAIPAWEAALAERDQVLKEADDVDAKIAQDLAFQAELAAGMGADNVPLPAGLFPREVVGGIEIGKQKWVGGEGRRIEKSAIVGGGKETFIGTVATSAEGIMMTTEEMKKLQIKDPKDVEKFRREMEKMANGKSWRLDVVDTPTGREYRGIVDTEEDSPPKKGEGEDGKSKEKPEKGEEGSQEEFYKEEL
ncbi:hypothetical protein K402DRAFT_322086 [Aulographum hederae CBS 113979]|uniref:Endoplasmic reticulum lectin n=1 Tax=Aulographum hederae CBS 113979 TaxID=1176131 RepID=A0A6G1HFT3_9PEZI|nr:hypothetical protein K402DRAFT_322086 [Aulographum hederae CBS 113979]